VIRYRYAQHVDPPAPFVYVAIRCPRTGRRAENVPALIDTAADRTILPASLVRSLDLAEDGLMLFQGFASDIVELPTFRAEVQIHDRPVVNVRAALGQHENHVLLGRDVLNTYRIVLGGPQNAFEINP
jgi:hypothetical protein